MMTGTVASDDSSAAIQALKTVETYAGTISCHNSFSRKHSQRYLLKHNVFKILQRPGYPVQKRPPFYHQLYYVLWSGNVGCSPGNAAVSWYVTAVGRASEQAPLLVLNRSAFGKQVRNEINFRYIESIKEMNPHEFVITALAYDFKHDAMCCPSEEYKYVLERKRHSFEWHIVSMHYLGNKSY